MRGLGASWRGQKGSGLRKAPGAFESTINS